MKECRSCHEVRSKLDFSPNKHNKDGRVSYCKPCYAARMRAKRKANPEHDAVLKRRAAYKAKYGITPEEYDEMLAYQGGCCAICGSLPDQGRRLAVDHDHLTRRVRGLLCANCNLALGKLKDDPALVRAAVEYLERS